MRNDVKVIAINGSPRKNWNTAMLLERAVAGAQSAGAQVETIDLYDLNFKGCSSCFACKRIDGAYTGRCVMRDDLSGILERLAVSQVLLLASPIYISDVTACVRALLERLVFSNIAYRKTDRSNFKGKLSIGCIYTMGLTEEFMEKRGYPSLFEEQMKFLSYLNGKTEYMTTHDMYQFDDYAKYETTLFDVAHKKKLREEQFPKDCERAFEMGARLTKEARAL